uniref:ABC transporter related n=1 Tax=Cyanothece sp. (strain PCC 7425 / ATCC 29141) TaxID=395961 RepID=B8HLN0_CYAP4
MKMKRQHNDIALLFSLFRWYPWSIPSMIALGCLASLCEGLGMSLFIPLLQSLQPNPGQVQIGGVLNTLLLPLTHWPGSYQLPLICLVIGLSILLKNIIVYLNTALFAQINSQINHRLRSQIFQQFLNVGYSFLAKTESGQLLHLLLGETWQTGQALSLLVNLIGLLCTITIFTLLLVLISWRLTLWVAIALIGLSFITQTLIRHCKQLGQRAAQVNGVLATRIWESCLGMKVIRAFGQEHYEQARFDRTSRQVQQAFLQMDLLSGAVGPFSEVVSTLILLLFLAVTLMQDRAALPLLLTFSLVLYRLQPQVKQFESGRANLNSLLSSVETVMAFLETRDKPYLRSGPVPYSYLQHGIRFSQVSFAYEAGQPALRQVSFLIPAGQTTALVGPSGAGKSTILELIFRFYEVTSGTIYIDDRPLPQLDLSSWRSHLAIVSQDIHIFSASVRENIAYGRLNASEAEIIAAAQQANAHEFICQLPQGYDTPVGDRGTRLSGGQRQRLALARAILSNPQILILDEATNALDSISENLIQEALQLLSQNRTVIVIAHRLATIAHADHIVVLENGQMVEQGAMQQLLQQPGLFYRMYKLQNPHALMHQ